jgi:hypothetical protein
MVKQKRRVSVKALDCVPTAQRALTTVEPA